MLMFLKHLGFFALPITNGLNFSPVLLHVNNTVTRSFANFPPLQASPFTPSVLSEIAKEENFYCFWTTLHLTLIP
jgi:hypothetical protein